MTYCADGYIHRHHHPACILIDIIITKMLMMMKMIGRAPIMTHLVNHPIIRNAMTMNCNDDD